MHWIRSTAVFVVGVAAVALAMTTSTPATAAALHAGDPDPTFGVQGRAVTDVEPVGVGGNTAIQPDGKILIVGRRELGQPPTVDFSLARFTPDGRPDETFGSHGEVSIDFAGAGSVATALAIQPDGKIVVAGDAIHILGDGTNVADFAVARFDINGTLDSTFSADGKLLLTVGDGTFSRLDAVAIQADGRIVLGGFVHQQPGTVVFHTSAALTRVTLDGRLDRSFGLDGIVLESPSPNQESRSIEAIAVQPDGKIVTAGDVRTATVPRSAFLEVSRYDGDGSPDGSFGIGGGFIDPVNGREFVSAVALQPDGKIVVAGSTLGSDGLQDQFLLTRYSGTDGATDERFGGDGRVITTFSGSAGVADVAVQPDGKILAVGSGGMARYDTNGFLDGSFGDDGKAEVAGRVNNAVALQADGKIVTFGQDSPTSFSIARFLGEASPVVQAGGPYSSSDGGPVTLTGTVSDSDSSTLTHTWTVAAQSDVDPGATCTIADPAALSTTVTCTDSGTYTVTLTAEDGTNPPTTQTAELTIANVAPSVTITAPTDGALVAGAVSITAHFTDPQSNDTHSCAADFGAGTSSAGTVAETAGAGTCTLTHAFTTGAHDVTVTVRDDDGGTGSASVHLVSAVPGAAFGLRATGPVTVAATPQVSCPPDQAKTTAALHTLVVSITGLSASCHIDPGTGVTTASASAGTITALGLIHLSGVESTCTSTADGLSGSSRVASINGRPIGSGPGSINILGVAQVFFNQTVTGNGQLTQNAIRIHTLLGEDIILASCHLG